MDQATIDKVKAENPAADIRKIALPDFDREYLVKIDALEWERFRANLADDDMKQHAVKQFAIGCMLYPSKADFVAELKALPGIAESLCKPLIKLHGAAAAATVEKV